MPKQIVIAGGGTGGHLFPGIALAQALTKENMDIDITFVGTQRGIEARVLPKEGFKLKTISSGGLLGKKGMERWLSWCRLPLGIVQSLFFLMRNRPSLVVGVGGYVSGPLVFSAWLLRIPILIHEQNVRPGVTNRWLGKIADKIAVSFKESESFFPAGRVEETGNMIREEFCGPREKTASGRDEKFRVLVLGGSLGAHSINVAMEEALGHFLEFKDSLYIVHQTGEKDYHRVESQYAEKGISAEVHPFIHDMAEQVRKASLIVCRAGATSLAEVTASGKPSILIPYPFAAHNHQERNARVLEAANAGEVILDDELSDGRLARAIMKFMKEPELLETMAENSYRLGKRDATEMVRRLCLELIDKGKRMSGMNGKAPGNYVLSCF